MDDHPSTYETQPRRSYTQWLESEPLYDWLLAAYQNTRRSARQIEPFVRKYKIDMSEFRSVVYRSFAEFFDREFRPGGSRIPRGRKRDGSFCRSALFRLGEIGGRTAISG